MQIEQLKAAATPEEMRAEICRLRMHDPIVRQVMDLADYRGLTAEDRYTTLAYFALKAMIAAHQRALDDAMTRPFPTPVLMTNGVIAAEHVSEVEHSYSAWYKPA